jgi:hypothetical protein
MIEIITIPMEDAVALAKAILAAEDAEDVEEAVVDVVEEETIVRILTYGRTKESLLFE